MLNMLITLTKGETSGNYETFIKSNYCCGLGLLQDLNLRNPELKGRKIKFYDNGQELLIYSNVGTYACNYITYCDIKFITSVYNKDGLVLEYDFDYESPKNQCLLEICDLKKSYPDRWIYKLDSIYSKYGVDLVNFVRGFARL